MTALILSYLPTFNKIEAQKMLRSTAIVVTALLCVTAAVLALIGGIVFLAFTGHGTDALTNYFNLAQLAGLVYAIGKIKSVERQTNGNLSKLTDAAIKSPPVDVP